MLRYSYERQEGIKNSRKNLAERFSPEGLAARPIETNKAKAHKIKHSELSRLLKARVGLARLWGLSHYAPKLPREENSQCSQIHHLNQFQSDQRE